MPYVVILRRRSLLPLVIRFPGHPVLCGRDDGRSLQVQSGISAGDLCPHHPGSDSRTRVWLKARALPQAGGLGWTDALAAVAGVVRGCNDRCLLCGPKRCSENYGLLSGMAYAVPCRGTLIRARPQDHPCRLPAFCSGILLLLQHGSGLRGTGAPRGLS